MADFQREYQLDLLGADHRLGADRFLLLAAGLSPHSLLWQRVESGRRIAADQPLTGLAAERALAAF